MSDDAMMEALQEWGTWASQWTWHVTGVALLVTTAMVVKRIKYNRLRRKWDSVGKDVVVLHQFQRGKACPNLSPFALKLESFLRLANIEYEVDTQKPFGPKGKCPWITLNGEDVADSELIVEHLTRHFDVKLDSRLESRKAANLQAVRVMADEHFFWCVITWRYWLDGCVSFLKSQSFSPLMRRCFPYFMKPGMKRKSSYQGMGLFSPQEIYSICSKDCATFAAVLGEDAFFGGEEPCTADCAVFGQLAQLMWNAPGSSYEALITEVHPNLANYCIRMKERVFPDWNKLLIPPQ